MRVTQAKKNRNELQLLKLVSGDRKLTEVTISFIWLMFTVKLRCTFPFPLLWSRTRETVTTKSTDCRPTKTEWMTGKDGFTLSSHFLISGFWSKRDTLLLLSKPWFTGALIIVTRLWVRENGMTDFSIFLLYVICVLLLVVVQQVGLSAIQVQSFGREGKEHSNHSTESC